MIVSLILAPFFILVAVNFIFRNTARNAIFWLGLLFCLGQAALALMPHSPFWAAESILLKGIFKFEFLADGFTKLMLLCIGMVMAATFVLGRSLVEGRHRRFDFYSLLLVALISLNGVVLTRDLFTLYVFIEAASITSFILITYEKSAHSFEAAFKYIIMSALASVLMISAMSLFLLICGTSDFAGIRSMLAIAPARFTLFASGMFLCGLFIKSGLMPFHGWLPDVYSSAPAPVSVLLGGIITKTVGVYALARVAVTVFGIEGPMKTVFLLVGVVSVVLGALASLTQGDFKRMLAYSSISQVGYIIMGLGSASALGIAGALFHIFNHAVFKSLLFVNAAAVEKQTGTTDIGRMSGLAQRMPVTGLTSVLGSLSAAGLPPLAGFWSKLIILIALWAAGFHIYAAIAAMASVLTLAYFLTLQRKAFFGELAEEFKNVKEAGPGFVLVSLAFGALIILIGIAAPFILKNMILPLGSSILGG